MKHEEALNFLQIAGLIDPDLKVTITVVNGEFAVRFRRIETTDLGTAYLQLELIRRELQPGQLNVVTLADRVLKDHVCGA